MDEKETNFRWTQTWSAMARPFYTAPEARRPELLSWAEIDQGGHPLFRCAVDGRDGDDDRKWTAEDGRERFSSLRWDLREAVKRSVGRVLAANEG